MITKKILDDIYSIDEYGKVFNTPRRGTSSVSIQMTERSNEKGYRVVYLTIDNNQRKYKVHRLVATAFIPNPLNKPEVNHKDGDKNNNHYSNLEWCTRLENMQHAWSNGLKKGVIIERKLTIESAKAIREEYKNGAKQFELAKKYNVTPSNICSVVNYKTYKI